MKMLIYVGVASFVSSRTVFGVQAFVETEIIVVFCLTWVAAAFLPFY